MRFGYSEVCLAHDTGERHPETADRLRAIREVLSRKHGVEYVDGAAASLAELTAVHDDEYVERLREFCENGGGQWDPDTVAVEETWDAARKSAGLARWAVVEAVEGADGRETPFALGRPPGHHATGDEAMGFCFFNNAAVAAQHAIDAGLAERVAIVDWDVHHGNGTEDIFIERGDVLYASVHEEGIYPGTGDIERVGSGDGEGANLNVPLAAGAGDSDYGAVLDRVIDPAIRRFDPGIVVVSAGFDAHRHDPISRMRVSGEGYGVLTDRIRETAREIDAALAFVLEGGYSLDMLAESVAMVHDVFDGRTPLDPEYGPDEDVRARIRRVREVHDLDDA